MTKDDREARAILQRALNKITCMASDRFYAFRILEEKGLEAALEYVARLAQVKR